ncbi:MAG: ATP-binding protein [Candidatus Asgardarchaeia archaeon]
MSYDKKERLLTYLKRVNYWWTTGSISDEDKGTLRREYIEKIENYLKLHRVICLAGLRRSGKTTLLFQFADYLIKKGVAATRIVYLKIDDVIDLISDLKELEDIYTELFGISIKSERVYFLLDEIHFMKDWQRQIKYFIDFKYKSKFIISGSSRTILFKDASESLLGRIWFIDVFPLTFKEFLLFYDIDVEKYSISLENFDFEKVSKFYLELIDKKALILNKLEEYLEVGGFPEWFRIKNKVLWHRLLSDDYFALTITKDILLIFNPRDPILLTKLAREIALLTTERTTYLGLAKRLDANKDTIKQYLYYLGSSMLVLIAEKYTKRRLSQEKAPKKVFFWEEGMRRAISHDYDIGKSVENIVVWHLFRKGISENTTFQPFYWKNKYEIDFVYVTKDDKTIPIEIKYREYIKKVYRGFLEFFGEGHKFKYAIIVTKDTFEHVTFDGVPFEVYYIPLWLFLILIG